MYSVYVIQSLRAKRLYVGYTSDIIRRMSEHNELSYGTGKKYALKNGPWNLLHLEENFPDRSSAMKREKFLKSGVGREWIKQKYSEKLTW